MAQGWVTAKLDPEGEVLWVTHFGGQGDNWYGGLAIDGDDNLYAVGEARTEMEAGDALVVKLSPDGEVLWQRRYAAPFEGEPEERPSQRLRRSCIDEAGHLLAIGRRFDSELHDYVVFIQRYSLAGELQAEYDYPDIESIAEVVPVAGGGVYLAWRNGLKPALVMLDEELSVVWARRWTAETVGTVFDLAVDAAGCPYIAVDHSPVDSSLGSALIKLDQGGSVLWSHAISADSTIDVGDIALLADGTLLLGGEYVGLYGSFYNPDQMHPAEMPLLIGLDGDGGWQSGWRLELIDELPTEMEWQMMYWGGGADWGYFSKLLEGPDGALFGLGRATTAHCQWTPLAGTSEPVGLPGESFALERRERTSVLVEEPVEHRAGELADAAEGYDMLLVTRLR